MGTQKINFAIGEGTGPLKPSHDNKRQALKQKGGVLKQGGKQGAPVLAFLLCVNVY